MMPDVEEFTKFYQCVMKSMPPGNKPHLFKLGHHSKAPLPGRSWKKDAPLSFKHAEKWMQQGGNIGIGAMDWNFIFFTDLDGKDASKTMFKIPTLTVETRSGGFHGYYVTKNKAEIPNLATNDQGEVRSQNQYVVAPGSYVPPEGKGTGYYRVVEARPLAWVTFNDLPEIFIEQYKKSKQQELERNISREPAKPRQSNGKCSAVFDVTAEDVLRRELGTKKSSERWGSIFHDSDTEANMSISREGKYLHCWRHSRALNGLACLAVKSGVITCENAGSPHTGSVGGNGIGDYEIFHAWVYAKQNNYIPADDPIPTRALNHIAEKHLGHKGKENEKLPWNVYLATIKIVEELY